MQRRRTTGRVVECRRADGSLADHAPDTGVSHRLAHAHQGVAVDVEGWTLALAEYWIGAAGAAALLHELPVDESGRP